MTVENVSCGAEDISDPHQEIWASEGENIVEALGTFVSLTHFSWFGQIIGKYWSLFLEHENCVAYKVIGTRISEESAAFHSAVRKTCNSLNTWAEVHLMLYWGVFPLLPILRKHALI